MTIKDMIVYVRRPDHEVERLTIVFDKNRYSSLHEFIRSIKRRADLPSSHSGKHHWKLRTMTGKPVQSRDDILNSSERKFALYSSEDGSVDGSTNRHRRRKKDPYSRDYSGDSMDSRGEKSRKTSRHGHSRGRHHSYSRNLSQSRHGHSKTRLNKHRRARSNPGKSSMSSNRHRRTRSYDDAYDYSSLRTSKAKKYPPIFRTYSDNKLFGAAKKKARKSRAAKSRSASPGGNSTSTMTYYYPDERNYDSHYSNPKVRRRKAGDAAYYDSSKTDAYTAQSLDNTNSGDIYIIPNHRSYSYIIMKESKKGKKKAGGSNKRSKSFTSAPAKHRKNRKDKKKPPEDTNEGVVRRSDWIMTLKDKDFIRDRFKYEKEIGYGNFAVVFRCYNRKTKETLAMKEIDKAKLKGKKQYVENEVELLARCQHPNIIRLVSAYQSTKHYYVAMELLDHGDLFDAIKANGSFSESVTAGVVYDVANALAYLHENGILHRDIKPENLLLTNDFRVKLADFGLACKVLGPLYRVCGTPTYVAPEILAQQGYGVEVDIWSLGIITYIMLCGYAPFRNDDRQKLFKKIKKGDFTFESKSWNKTSDSCMRFIKNIILIKPSERLTSAEVLKSRWVRRKR